MGQISLTGLSVDVVAHTHTDRWFVAGARSDSCDDVKRDVCSEEASVRK